MGINTTMGIGYLASMLNRYMEVDLAYYTMITATQKNSVADKMAVFTNYTPRIESVQPEREEGALLDLSDITSFRQESSIEKYMLVQAKGEYLNLFPRIKQIDFVFISNYALHQKKAILQMMEGINYSFDLTEEHLGAKSKYFRELMW